MGNVNNPKPLQGMEIIFKHFCYNSGCPTGNKSYSLPVIMGKTCNHVIPTGLGK